MANFHTARDRRAPVIGDQSDPGDEGDSPWARQFTPEQTAAIERKLSKTEIGETTDRMLWLFKRCMPHAADIIGLFKEKGLSERDAWIAVAIVKGACRVHDERHDYPGPRLTDEFVAGAYEQVAYEFFKNAEAGEERP